MEVKQPKEERTIIFVNKPTICTIFLYVYFYFLHVSDSHIPIIRRINCINATVWYAGRNEIPTCIPDGYLHRVKYTRCRIDTINSPDDGHMAVRNM